MTMMMAPSKAVLAGKADADEAAEEVFPAGQAGDVASTALASGLDEAAVEAVESPETPEARAASGDGEVAAAEEGSSGDEARASAEQAPDEQGSSDTADASADTAVS